MGQFSDTKHAPHEPSAADPSLYNQPGPASVPDHEALPSATPINTDAPPLYDEVTDSDGLPLLPPFEAAHSHLLEPAHLPLPPFLTTSTKAIYLSSILDNSPALLKTHLRGWASAPPRPFLRLRGTHLERRTPAGSNRNEDRFVTDFDVRVELTAYLRGGALGAVRDDQRVHRGGIVQRTGAGSADGRIELGAGEAPSVTEWCHRYCAAGGGLKVFKLRRRVEGLDEARLTGLVRGLVARTGYRGTVQVTVPVEGALVEVWNECRTNRWRHTAWICGLFYLSMLWVFTWPYLFLRTKKFDTVSAVWSFSRVEQGRKIYAAVSEEQVYDIWGRAIAQAVLSRRQGVLDQEDLLATESMPVAAFNVGIWGEDYFEPEG